MDDTTWLPTETPDRAALLDATRRRRHRYQASIAVAATAVAVVAAVMAVHLTGHSANPRHPAAPFKPRSTPPSTRRTSPAMIHGTPPPTIEQDGKTLTYVGEEVWSQPTIDESDPNSVIVFASVDGGTASWGNYCTIGTTAIGRVVTETDNAVTVAVSKYSIRPKTATDGCLLLARGPIPVRVGLAKPLGDRQLIDAKDRVARKVLDPKSVLRPTYLPAGYTGGQPTWANQALTSAERSYRGPKSDLTITVGPASLNKPLRNILKHTTIRGHAATVSFDTGFAYDLRIAWNEDRHGVTLYQISRYDNRQGLGLTADQLIRIANGLR